MFKKTLVAAVVAALVAVFAASAAFAGEITGNGRVKPVNGNSNCAYSGQEDLQWYASNGDNQAGEPLENPVKGEPAHSQNWGHVKQENGLTGGANATVGPEGPTGCNAHLYGRK